MQYKSIVYYSYLHDINVYTLYSVYCAYQPIVADINNYEEKKFCYEKHYNYIIAYMYAHTM